MLKESPQTPKPFTEDQAPSKDALDLREELLRLGRAALSGFGAEGLGF